MIVTAIVEIFLNNWYVTYDDNSVEARWLNDGKLPELTQFLIDNSGVLTQDFAVQPTAVINWDSTNLVKTTSSTDTTAESMLQVGYFGLGGEIPRGFSTDPNTLQTGFHSYRRRSPDGDNPPAFLASNRYSMIIPLVNELTSLSKSIVISDDNEMYLTSGNPDKFTNQAKFWTTNNTIVDVNDFIKEL